MRFIVAWANVVSENLILKFSLVCLAIVIFVLSVVVVRLSGRKPLIIERACYSRPVSLADAERTPLEIEAFVREALSARFDTSGPIKPGYLSSEETRFRDQEQQELRKREMSQRVFVNSVVISGQSVVVNADRLLSMGAVRSVLSFPLALTLGSVSRSDGNPYGLSLLRVSVPKADGKSEGSKQ